jgi:hypothetical protein
MKGWWFFRILILLVSCPSPFRLAQVILSLRIGPPCNSNRAGLWIVQGFRQEQKVTVLLRFA